MQEPPADPYLQGLSASAVKVKVIFLIRNATLWLRPQQFPAISIEGKN
jgi:hypothetical protein